MLITDQGTIIRTPAAGIQVYSRTASGVRVMRLEEDQKLVAFTKVAKESEEDEAADAPVADSENVSGDMTGEAFDDASGDATETASEDGQE